MPTTHYARVGESDVAYQVLGDGPVDLVYSWGIGNSIETAWRFSLWYEYLEGLSSVARVILFDRRGTGISGPTTYSSIPNFEESIEDLTAVMAAAGSTRASIFGVNDSALNAILLAAMRPELVDRLVIMNGSARSEWAEDYPAGQKMEILEGTISIVERYWGTDDFAKLANPTAVDDLENVRFSASQQRISNSPRSAAAQVRYLVGRDGRWALSFVQCPTLILHSIENQFIPLAQGQYLAEHIPDAKFIEMPGADLGLTPAVMPFLSDVCQFVAGVRPVERFDRILSTVLFTDIVDSTKVAASIGDRRWRETLDRHDVIIRDSLRRFGGREINTTGDGFVMTFDSPARAVRFAEVVREEMIDVKLELRFGIHTGECEVRGEDIAGLAVHIAARIGSEATAGEILVSSTVRELVMGSNIQFVDRGERSLKGVPGEWRLFAAT
jgi:class 3 adenylate cyclase/pimeloyl-ACP methyl ester carboxylesterase